MTVAELSPAEVLAGLDDDGRRAALAGMADSEVEALMRSWRFWARPKQRAPAGPWRWWLLMTGRGYGKNRTGSEWLWDRCEAFAAADAPHLVGLMNATYSDVRALQLGGESGMRAVAARRGHRVSMGDTALEGELVVRHAGRDHTTRVEVHTADQPDRVRGRNFHTLWADEAAKWKHKEDAEGGTAFTNADLGLRALCPDGLVPQGIVTTTPKPLQLLRDLVNGEYGATAVTRGSMFENRANLATAFLEAVLRRYSGTRLGAQEIEGLLLDTVEGALWTPAGIEATRWRQGRDPLPDLFRVVVGVDPSGSPSGAATGIVVVGAFRVGVVTHALVLEDASVQGETEEWAREAVAAYHRWDADRLVGEQNYGGDMVRGVIALTDPNVRYDKVVATRGKAVRAEPVAALWAPLNGRGHILGSMPELEEQVCTWVPGDPVSPDRMDALVWAVSYLIPQLARRRGAARATKPEGQIPGRRPA